LACAALLGLLGLTLEILGRRAGSALTLTGSFMCLLSFPVLIVGAVMSAIDYACRRR
jgi:hypothetical protein